MSKITAAYLGVLVLVTYFSTQVSSQTPMSNTTVTMASNTTMMQTNTSSAAGNATTPSGAVSFTRSGAYSVLLPVAMAASLVFTRC